MCFHGENVIFKEENVFVMSTAVIKKIKTCTVTGVYSSN